MATSSSSTTAEVSSATIAAAADRLRTAARTATPCPPVRDLIGSDDVDSAYAVQRALADGRRAEGARVVGRKIGLTSPSVQAQLGVDRPDFGVLFDDMCVEPGSVVGFDRLLQPRIEAEVAFVLAADLTDPAATADTVRPAVAYACAALEIVDSRIAGWDISFSDTVADNGSSGLFTLGTDRVGLDEFEPVLVEMTMSMDDEVVSTGTGAACLGDPLNALAWLARTAVAVGDPLRAGDVVLSGALGPMVAVSPGARIHAQITGLGTVDAVFGTDGSSA